LVINVGTLGIGGGSQIAGQSIGRVARTAAESFGPQIERGLERAVPGLRFNAVPEGLKSMVVYPEGLAYRTDLPNHLFGPDGFTKTGQLSGTHNLQNATSVLDAHGATYSLSSTATKGISELEYAYTNANGKLVRGSKTVYEQLIFSDQTMLDMSQRVGQRGYEMYLKDPGTTRFDLSEGGVNFRAYINIDPKTGIPYVGNVHPIR
ncbi:MULTISPECIES: CdiA family toxin C-terminal domain-containing protein, partial [unclassified Caballeronia]|uniref:CdiA family toxin C-terminal domain-containing protein n=1 Tax=unclassified Caballeronia TaxID=2646786 RepID=UPI0028663F50